MHLSWSHKLFFRINAHVGKNAIFDRALFVCAYALIYLLAVLVFSWGAFVLVPQSSSEFVGMMKLMISAFVFAEIFSYGLALLWRHPRPIIEFPEIKALLQPIENWKSFPSDHTIVSTILVTIPLMLGIGFAFGLLLSILALLIMFARIYVGVHYPRDILGGIAVGVFFSLSSVWLLTHVTQPIYDFIKLILIG
jgi:undecaprenyl-diphosphatase